MIEPRPSESSAPSGAATGATPGSQAARRSGPEAASPQERAGAELRVSVSRAGRDPHATMGRRLPIYLLLAALATMVYVAGWIVAGARQNGADLALVRAEMGSAEWQTSRARLEGLAGSIGARRRAVAGLVVIEALTGSGESTLQNRVEARELAYFPLGLLLERAFAEERYDGCLRLVGLLRRAGAPSFPEFEAAALLELGRLEEARGITGMGTWTGTRVRRRLHEVFAGDPDDVLVRDRTGVLLGKARLGDGGVFHFAPEPGVDAVMVPQPAIEGLGAVLPARSVRLTVDRQMSEMALRALGSYRGSIVVVDPRDGSVLAAVSDRRSAAEGEAPALEQMREPASIAKLITVSAALRAGLDVDAILHDMVCRGSIRFEDGVLYCSAVNGRLGGLDRALAVSCNVAFARIGEMVGRRALLDEYRRYGFDRGGDDSRFFGKVLQPEGSPRQLGDLSIGLEATSITPVHAALEAATVANGGFMHEPRLYRSTAGFLGLAEHPIAAAEGWQVLDESWPPLLTRAMIAVASPGGTAARVAPAAFPVALKTGTASEPATGFHVNYIGFGPLPDARYAFAVRVTNQRSSRRVHSAAFAVTRRFLQGMARLEGPRPVPPPHRRPRVAAFGVESAGGG